MKTKDTETKKKSAGMAPLQRQVICLFEIDGYGIVLPQVQNYYPAEEDKPGMFCWGFKYTSGIFEFFYYATLAEAEQSREAFKTALNDYWRVCDR